MTYELESKCKGRSIVKRNFKLELVMILCIVSMVCVAFTGCILPEDYEYVSEEAKLYNDAVDEFLDALDEGDNERILEMFSDSARNGDADIEEEIDMLIEAYPGPTDACNRNGKMVAGEYSNERYGIKTSSVYSIFTVVSNGEYYWCYFELMYENDEDEDQIGVTKVIFYSADEYCDLRYNGAKYEEELGLKLCMEDSLDCEVRAIAGSPYKYTSTGVVLDEDDVKGFMEETNSYTEFVEKYGEPNAIEVYYCYELPDENGEPRYLQLSVDEEDDVIRNISVNSDLEWKYLLWKNEE